MKKYIGQRYLMYIPEDNDWNVNQKYEHFTVVLHEGNSYISRIDVPKGIDINNKKYWSLFSNYDVKMQNLEEEFNNFKNFYDNEYGAMKNDTKRNITLFVGETNKEAILNEDIVKSNQIIPQIDGYYEIAITKLTRPRSNGINTKGVILYEESQNAESNGLRILEQSTQGMYDVDSNSLIVHLEKGKKYQLASFETSEYHGGTSFTNNDLFTENDFQLTITLKYSISQ
jgi:hypothetical protein